MALSRLERYSIAITLASSLLQLYSSPWIGEAWSKDDIYFLIAAEGSLRPILVEKPYITRKVTSYSPQSSVDSISEKPARTSGIKSIQALGIMLLGLCFGEAIEDQPIRSKYLGPDGQPNDMTDFCTAQHWLQHDALGEGGPDFFEAIRRCLFCAFGPKSTDLEDDELRSAIHSEVVDGNSRRCCETVQLKNVMYSIIYVPPSRTVNCEDRPNIARLCILSVAMAAPSGKRIHSLCLRRGAQIIVHGGCCG